MTATRNFADMRAAMVAGQLRTNNVTDARILAAFSAVPRERFVLDAYARTAYTDGPVAVGHGRYLNVPLATARLMGDARPDPLDTVLLIGAVTGYATTIVARLCKHVHALEENVELFHQLRDNMASFETVTAVRGPLCKGWAAGAPYTLILIDGAIEHLDEHIVEQCAEGGRIAAAVVNEGVTRLAIGYKAANNVTLLPFSDVQSVVLPGFTRPQDFRF